MKKLNKVIAVLCSATMILGSTMTAFAADEPDTAAGAGNIIVFSVETVTLPTSVKVAFNPNGYKITPRDGATPVTDQIVSLNYGIASTANKDRKITVSFTATGKKAEGHTGTEEVVFVDDIKKAQAKSESNADGADYGEYKLYLAAVAASAAPTKQSGDAFAVGDFGTDSIGATKTALADVKFTAAEKGEVAFANNKAEMAYKLDKATYTQKETGGEITFATAQADIASKFDLTALGTNGLVGFTFKGAMNPNTDWTKANITALEIQPEYAIEDLDGTEEALGANGGLGQIATAPAVTTAYASIQNLGGKNMLIVTPTNGSTFATTLAAADITSYKAKYNNGEFVDAKAKVAVSAGKIGVTTADLQSLLGFSGLTTGDKITVELTVSGTNYQAVYTR